MNTEHSKAALTFHHTGLLTENLEETASHYAEIFGPQAVSAVYFVQSQQVKVCFVQVGADAFIELVQPVSEDSVVSNLLKKRISYYHTGYKVKDLSRAIERLEQLHYKAMTPFASEAFEGKSCVFLLSPEGTLIELIGE